MRYIYNYIKALFFSGTLLIMSCQSKVNLNLPGYDPQIVVEGYIENGLTPVVQLTKSVAYFQPYTLDSFYNSYVHNAIVIVSDGTIKDTLTEFNPAPFLSGGLKDSLRFYAYLDIRPVPKIKGKIGKTYTLDIYAQGKHLSSVTMIHPPAKVDSVWTGTPVGARDTTRRAVFMNILDPATQNDYYKFYDCKNLHLSGVAALDDYYIYPQRANNTAQFGDQFFNGKVFTFRAGGYHRKDTAYIKFCHIDKAQFDYWITIQQSAGSQGSPFSSPSYIKSNISNGLGIWGGIGATYTKVVIDK